MKRCLVCKVDVDSPLENCPLCSAGLEHTDAKPELATYPNLAGQAEAYNLVLRVLIFMSLTIIAISITVNIMTSWTSPWSLIVAASIGYLWIALGTAIRRWHKFGFNIMMQVINLSLLLIALGYIVGFYPWVFNLILPALIGTGLLSFHILFIIRQQDVSSFVLYFLIVAVLGFVPFLLYLLGLATVSWPSVTLAVFSGLTIVSIFIFADKATGRELKKRFKI